MAVHPSNVQNSFGGHAVLWTLFIPLLSLIFIPLVDPSAGMISRSEVAMLSDMNLDVDALTASANASFESMFVSNGLVVRTEAFFGYGQPNGQPSVAGNWIHGVWLMLYKATWRIYALGWMFFFPMLLLVLPAAVDGFVVRARKKYRFESSNPVFFYSSMHAVVMMLGMFAFLPLAPVALTAEVMLGLLIVLAAGTWMATSHFQTGA
jgi:hypothetical protein